MTTTKGLIIGGDSSGVASGAFGGYYEPIGGTFQSGDTTESRWTYSLPAGTFKNMAVRCTVNTSSSGTETLQFRKNGSNGNQIVSIAFGTTGWFTDSTHSDTTAANDTGTYFRNGAGFSNNTLTIFLIELDVSSPQFVWIAVSSGNITFSTTETVQDVCGVAIRNNTGSSESTNEALVNVAVTWKGLNANVFTAPAATVTIKSRKNNTNANQVLSITTTGIVQDSTHTDSLVIADRVLYDEVQASGSISGAMHCVASYITGTTSAYDVPGQAQGSSNLNNGTFFTPLGGCMAFNTTETNYKVHLPYGFTASAMWTHLRANSGSGGTIVLHSRQNGANGNQSISITVGSLGNFQDSTHTDSYASADDANGSIVVPSGMTLCFFDQFGMLIDDGSATGATIYNDSVTEAVTAADSCDAGFSIGANVTESVTATDLAVAEEDGEGALNEAVAAADTPTAQCDFVTSLTESVAATDSCDGIIVAGAHGDALVVVMGQ